MKRKDLAVLRQKGRPELEKLLREEREKLWGLSRDLAAGKLKNANAIGESKKTIARILTFLRGSGTL